MRRNSGELDSSQLEFDSLGKAEQEAIWQQIMNGNRENVDKLDKQYLRLATALNESSGIPLKEELDSSEMAAVQADLEAHGEFVGGDYIAHPENAPRLILGEDVTEITDQEAELLAKFRGIVLMNYVQRLSLEQARSLIELQGPLFVKGLKPEKDAFIAVSFLRTDAKTKEQGIQEVTYAKLPDDINDALARRKYATFVADELQIAFREKQNLHKYENQTVEIEKPE